MLIADPVNYKFISDNIHPFSTFDVFTTSVFWLHLKCFSTLYV